MSDQQFENIKLEIEGQIALLTIDRPQVLNSLNRETLSELEEAFRVIRKEDQVGAVILTGAGEKAFAAGADLEELAQLEDSLQARKHSMRGQAVLDSIETFPKPVIAAINGVCIRGWLRARGSLSHSHCRQGSPSGSARSEARNDSRL